MNPTFDQAAEMSADKQRSSASRSDVSCVRTKSRDSSSDDSADSGGGDCGEVVDLRRSVPRIGLDGQKFGRRRGSQSSANADSHGLQQYQAKLLLALSITGGGGGGGGVDAAVRPSEAQQMRGPVDRTVAIQAAIAAGDVVYDEHGFALDPAIASAYRSVSLVRSNKSEIYVAELSRMRSHNVAELRDNEAVAMLTIGLPLRHRRALWLEWSGAEVCMLTHRSHYRHLCRRLKSRSGSDQLPATVVEEIERDLGRTAGFSIHRDQATMRKRMRFVLQLHALDKPHEGYCQGGNFFVMSFLLQGMTDEEAFWMLDCLTQRLFPCSFDRAVTGQVADLATFEYYFRKSFGALHALYKEAHVDVGSVCAGGLIGSLLCDKMPYESVWCVWDVMFAGGAVEFFVALLKIMAHVAASLPRRFVPTATPRGSEPAPAPGSAASSPRGKVASVRRGFALSRSPLREDVEAIAPPPRQSQSSPRGSSPTPARLEFDIDGTDAIVRTNSIIASIVDMPGLLARTKLERKPDARGLQLRRMKHRVELLRQTRGSAAANGRSSKHVSETSSSSTSGSDADTV